MAKAKTFIQQMDEFHKTKKGLLVFAAVELLLAYLVASRAIETGSLWQYFLTFVLLFGAIQNSVKFAGIVMHGKK